MYVRKNTKKSINVLVRTTGGKNSKNNLGMGHIYRILNLLKSMKMKNVNFLLEDYGSAKKVLEERGFKKITLLQPKISVINDLKVTKNIIDKQKIDLIIIDKYPLQKKYVKDLKKIVKTIVISDLKNISYDADLIVNGFIGFKNKHIQNKYGTRCLLGPKYQILNENFKNKKKTSKKYDCLITLGGANDKQFIMLLLRELKYNSQIKKIRIITGPAFQNYSQMKGYSDSQISIIRKTTDMKKEIIASKFGICAGGITTYEFAAMNVPFVIVCVARHQLITAKEWEKYGVKNLGMKNSLTVKKIQKFLKNKEFKRTNSLLIDGLGSKRIANEIKKIM